MINKFLDNYEFYKTFEEEAVMAAKKMLVAIKEEREND